MGKLSTPGNSGMNKLFAVAIQLQEAGENPVSWLMSYSAGQQLCYEVCYSALVLREAFKDTLRSPYEITSLLGYPVEIADALGERMMELIGSKGSRITFEIPKYLPPDVSNRQVRK